MRTRRGFNTLNLVVFWNSFNVQLQQTVFYLVYSFASYYFSKFLSKSLKFCSVLIWYILLADWWQLTLLVEKATLGKRRPSYFPTSSFLQLFSSHTTTSSWLNYTNSSETSLTGTLLKSMFYLWFIVGYVCLNRGSHRSYGFSLSSPLFQVTVTISDMKA